MLTAPSDTLLDSILDVLVTASESGSSATRIDDQMVPLVDLVWGLLAENKITAAQFVKLIEVADRLTNGNALLIEAIETSLSHDVIAIARQLTQHGQKLYPESDTLKRMGSVLLTPEVLNSDQPPVDNLSTSMIWLHNHSAEYAGKWVALEDGVLRGTALSRKVLVEQLGSIFDPASVLITRIP